MKIEEPGTASQEKQRISIEELSNDELLELSDEEMLQIVGGGSIELQIAGGGSLGEIFNVGKFVLPLV